MTNKIVILGWRLFVKRKKETIIFIVREFCANVSDVVDDMVRIMLVKFGASNINSFYGMKDVG